MYSRYKCSSAKLFTIAATYYLMDTYFKISTGKIYALANEPEAQLEKVRIHRYLTSESKL